MAPPVETANPVSDIVARLRNMSGDGPVTLRDLITAFGEASFVPALMVPALLVVSPLSGIPLFSSICGLTIALIALQMLMARQHLWLPGVLMNRTLDGPRLRQAIGRIEGGARWLDRRTKARFGLFSRWPFRIMPQAACVLCGAAMPFLELVPFSSSILGTAVVCFSISFLARDGLFVLVGAAFMGIAAMVPAFVLYRFGG